MYTALVFIFLKICGLVCNENTTSYYNVHPEQDKYEMQVYGLSSEPSLERYPVEKIGEYKKFHFMGFIWSTCPALAIKLFLLGFFFCGYKLTIFLIGLAIPFTLASNIIGTYNVIVLNILNNECCLGFFLLFCVCNVTICMERL